MLSPLQKESLILITAPVRAVATDAAVGQVTETVAAVFTQTSRFAGDSLIPGTESSTSIVQSAAGRAPELSDGVAAELKETAGLTVDADRQAGHYLGDPPPGSDQETTPRPQTVTVIREPGRHQGHHRSGGPGGNMAPMVAPTDRGIAAPGAALAPTHRTPVLRVDTRLVERRYVTLSCALPDVHLHYAVKANPAPQVLRTLQALGCRWDVASPGEIDAVLAAGGEPAQMSYGNTIKKSADISYAAARGVRRFTLDSAPELAKLIELAPGATMLIRLATSGAGADWALGSKFGCPEPEAARLLEIAYRAGHPVGVSFHVGSQQRNPLAWDEPLAASARLRAWLRAIGGDLAVVDLGGGFPAATLDAAPFDGRYGATVVSSLERHFGDDRPELMAEPGRALVADAGVLETEVVLVAERDGIRWVYLDVGVFSGLVEASGEGIRYLLEVRRDGLPLTGEVGETILAGPTCDSVDVLFSKHRYRLPVDLRPGDVVTFLSAGAYTATYSSVGFNGFAPLREVYR